MLWRFDAVVLAFILPALMGALILHHHQTVRRSLTLIGILAVLTLALALRRWGVWGLTALVVAGGLYEISRNWRVSWLALTLAGGLGVAAAATAPFGASVWLLAVWGLTVLASWVMPGRVVAGRGFAMALALGIVGMGMGSWARLAILSPAGALTFIFLLQMNDAFGYFGGHLCGHRHIVAAISPGKTLEGYVAGAMGTAIGVALAYHPLRLMMGANGLMAMGVGMSIVFMGNLGDLSFSKIKRHLNIKDFSGFLPGHGGILDRFDNIMMVAPAFLWLWHFLGLGR
ncbi:MAG: phosphatidate cytidylyltransferase [Firmicutes bacterium]|nr:phosphatidate cytidylyltransferase [Bacillota bacterium]